MGLSVTDPGRDVLPFEFSLRGRLRFYRGEWGNLVYFIICVVRTGEKALRVEAHSRSAIIAFFSTDDSVAGSLALGPFLSPVSVPSQAVQKAFSG